MCAPRRNDRRQVFPEGHAAHTGFGHVDRFEPDAQLVGVQAAEPAAGRAAVTRATPRVRLAGIVLDRGCGRRVGQLLRLAATHRLGHEIVVEIAGACPGAALASSLVRRRGDAGELPMPVEQMLALEPHPGVVLRRGPMLRRRAGRGRSRLGGAHHRAPPADRARRRSARLARLNMPKPTQNMNLRRRMTKV